jgi:3',5'-cyclic AMP phosphodiesterase CpdA
MGAMLVAQITDTHIGEPGSKVDRVHRTAEHLARAVAHLNALPRRPDAVLATGDLVDLGSSAEYARLRELLAPLAAPLFVIPGNHDARPALRAAFADHRYLPAEGFLQYTIEHLPVRFVCLDTLVPGEIGGALCAERLDWLDRRLAEQPDRPTVVVMHHPPIRTGISRMDRWGLDGADAFGAVIARHRQVARVLCGHLHRPVTTHWQGTLVQACPATAHQIALELEGESLATVMEPPACLLHLWDAASGLVSHTSYIGDYGPLMPVGGK